MIGSPFGGHNPDPEMGRDFLLHQLGTDYVV